MFFAHAVAAIFYSSKQKVCFICHSVRRKAPNVGIIVSTVFKLQNHFHKLHFGATPQFIVPFVTLW